MMQVIEFGYNIGDGFNLEEVYRRYLKKSEDEDEDTTHTMEKAILITLCEFIEHYQSYAPHAVILEGEKLEKAKDLDLDIMNIDGTPVVFDFEMDLYEELEMKPKTKHRSK